MYVCMSVCLSVCLTVCLTICLSIYLSVRLYFCLCFAWLFFCVCLTVCTPVDQIVWFFICFLSFCISILPVYVHACLFVGMFVWICLPVCFSPTLWMSYLAPSAHMKATLTLTDICYIIVVGIHLDTF